MNDRIEEAIDFVKEIAVAAKDHIVNFVKGFAQHFESISVLTLSSLGLSGLLAEIPFYVALPMWVEAPMFIPVVSVLIILGIMKIAEVRADRRLMKAVV